MGDVLFVIAFLLLTASAGLAGTALAGGLVGAAAACMVAGIAALVVALALTDGKGLKWRS